MVVCGNDFGGGRVDPTCESGNERGATQNCHYDDSMLVSYSNPAMSVPVLTW